MATGYDSPEAMFAAWQEGRGHQHTGTLPVGMVRQSLIPRVQGMGPSAPAPPSQETNQTPRQWTMVTIKRCTVTQAEYRYWGTVEAVLQTKGFPAGVPEDGTILLSWFDQAEQMAYYELARMQDQGELAAYMLEHFKPRQDGGVERTIEFE